MPHTTRQASSTSAARINSLTAAARVWVICDTLGANATRDKVLRAAKRLGVHERTALNHFNLWRYAHKQEHVAQALPTRTRHRIARAAKVKVA